MTDDSQGEDAGIVAAVTAIVREADRLFETVGGSSRHWVRDCFLPLLNRQGFSVACAQCRYCGEDLKRDDDGDWIDRETHSTCVGEAHRKHEPASRSTLDGGNRQGADSAGSVAPRTVNGEARDTESSSSTTTCIPSPAPQATYPIPLNTDQEQAAKEWAADDRLWTTQETVEFNLRTFARVILKLAAPLARAPQEDSK